MVIDIFPIDSDDIGSGIRMLRNSRGMTQEQLAEKVNRTASLISKVENNKNNNLRLVLSIIAALNYEFYVKQPTNNG